MLATALTAAAPAQGVKGEGRETHAVNSPSAVSSCQSLLCSVHTKKVSDSVCVEAVLLPESGCDSFQVL